ncbi:MAG: S1 RNA-binding domain-containing protein, partial [Desulfovibrio sp.]|nr:S1 RNA-binding domain-containing protein [Desulfovibrio sp.]
IQMDIKITGLTTDIMRTAMFQAHEARLHILEEMNRVISSPRGELSSYAPQYKELEVNPDIIRLIIGPGGKNIKTITSVTGASVDIEDTGKISIFAPNSEALNKACEMIKYYDQRPEVGKNYLGKVKKLLEIGAIVEILPNVEALVHISQLDLARIESVEAYISVGEDLEVKVTEIVGDRVKASHKAVLLEEQGKDWEAANKPKKEGHRPNKERPHKRRS